MYNANSNYWGYVDDWGSAGRDLLCYSDSAQRTKPLSAKDDTAAAQSSNHALRNSCRGVYFDNMRHLWRANWPEETVVLDRQTKKAVSIKRSTKTKGFSAKKYGYEESRRLAIEHRNQMIQAGIVRNFVYMDEHVTRSGACKKRFRAGQTDRIAYAAKPVNYAQYDGIFKNGNNSPYDVCGRAAPYAFNYNFFRKNSQYPVSQANYSPASYLVADSHYLPTSNEVPYTAAAAASNLAFKPLLDELTPQTSASQSYLRSVESPEASAVPYSQANYLQAAALGAGSAQNWKLRLLEKPYEDGLYAPNAYYGLLGADDANVSGKTTKAGTPSVSRQSRDASQDASELQNAKAE